MIYDVREVKSLKRGGWYVYRKGIQYAGPFDSKTAAEAWIARA